MRALAASIAVAASGGEDEVVAASHRPPPSATEMKKGSGAFRHRSPMGFLAATYSPGRWPSTIGATGLTAVFGMGTGVSPPL